MQDLISESFSKRTGRSVCHSCVHDSELGISCVGIFEGPQTVGTCESLFSNAEIEGNMYRERDLVAVQEEMLKS